jgi:phage tail tube protein FII
MKNILLIIIAMTFCSKDKNTNEKFVTICKVSSSIVRIDYLDSTHGITNIDKEIKKDTLFLNISVGKNKPQKNINVKFSKGIKFISTGTTLYEIDKLEYCKKVYSGKDALEQLKKQKIE